MVAVFKASYKAKITLIHKRVLPLSVLIIIGIAQQFLMGGTFAFARYVLVRLDPFVVAFMRFCLASIILYLIAHRVSLRPNATSISPRDKWKIILLGFIIIVLNQALYLYGQKFTSAAHGGLIFATTPIFVYLLAIKHLKERWSFVKGSGILVAVVGAALIFFENGMEFNLDFVKGDLIILAAVLSWGYYTVWGKPLVEKYGALRVTAYALGAGTVIYFPFGLYRTIIADWSRMDTMGWVAVLYIAIGTSVIGYTIWYWLLKHMEASRLGIINSIQPVAAALYGFYFLDETITPVFLLATFLIIIGVMVTQKA